MDHRNVHVFTSITSNYLPKARVLAASVKKLAPACHFHLMLSDDPPPGFSVANEPFDHLIHLQDLALENAAQWAFGHTVVELCTAVKGFAFQYLLSQPGADKVFYFDPDMVVFGRLDELVERLDQSSILLTPHQCEPEETLEAIADNEIASLKHGVFNLGFLGIRNSAEGRRFVDWWASRLHHFCRDAIGEGLFTDQRWVDLAPCFFEDVEVMRDAGFNVATWNLSHRRVSGTIEDGVRINDEALGFYHFSGFDSGAQEVMLGKYGDGNPALHALRDWYIDACERAGQSVLGKRPARHACYADGTPITKPERTLYRQREDLRSAFPDPYATEPANACYRDWYRVHGPTNGQDGVLLARHDARYASVVEDFLRFTEQRLDQTHRLGGWRKRLARQIVRLFGRTVARLAR